MMHTRVLRWAKQVICIAACASLCGCMGANYYLKRGQVEYTRQDYHQAFADTLAAAKYSNPQAQYAVGYMYYYGIGTEQNDYLAAYWFDQAARLGDPKAIAALNQLRARAPYPFIFGLSKSQRGKDHRTPPANAFVHPAAAKKTSARPAMSKTTTAKKPYVTYKTVKKTNSQPKSYNGSEHLPPPHSTYVH